MPDDIEPMVKEGYGSQYLKDFDGNDLTIKLSPKSDVIDLYNQHHQRLNTQTRKSLCHVHTIFVVDCHSFGDH